jgi:hypothetical protein
MVVDVVCSGVSLTIEVNSYRIQPVSKKFALKFTNTSSEKVISKNMHHFFGGYRSAGPFCGPPLRLSKWTVASNGITALRRKNPAHP